MCRLLDSQEPPLVGGLPAHREDQYFLVELTCIVKVMTKADFYTLVDELPEEALSVAAFLLERLLRGQVDPDQAWVWTAEGQERLRSSQADLEAGRTQRFSSSEEFLASL